MYIHISNIWDVLLFFLLLSSYTLYMSLKHMTHALPGLPCLQEKEERHDRFIAHPHERRAVSDLKRIQCSFERVGLTEMDWLYAQVTTLFFVGSHL